MISNKIIVPQEKIADFCRRNHIHKLSLFGSVFRGDFGPDSDMDVLVEFETGHVPDFSRSFDLEKELSSLFNGRKVDLRTPGDVSRHFRNEVVVKGKVQ
jgi:predicted nucleotidyltransferase